MHKQNTKEIITVKESFSVTVGFHKTFVSISSAYTTVIFKILS